MQTNFFQDEHEINNKLLLIPEDYDEKQHNDRIINLSHEVIQVTELMQSLNDIVKSHHDNIDIIAENILDTKVITEIAHKELIAANISHSKYKSLMLYSALGLLTICTPFAFGIKAATVVASSAITIIAGHSYFKN